MYTHSPDPSKQYAILRKIRGSRDQAIPGYFAPQEQINTLDTRLIILLFVELTFLLGHFDWLLNINSLGGGGGGGGGDSDQIKGFVQGSIYKIWIIK